METQKISNLLGDADNESSKLAARKWYVINDHNNTVYGEGKEMVQLLNLKLKSLNQVFTNINFVKYKSRQTYCCNRERNS